MKSWLRWLFRAAGACLALLVLAVWGASSLWSIGELFEQRERVAKGWFPKNPKRK